MGLFDKKYCDVCGEKIGLLGNRKLDDGNLCKDCANRLSPFFSERKHSTVAQIREQLAYRAENERQLADFHPTTTIGRGMKVFVDQPGGRFVATRAADCHTGNPDIIPLSQVTACNVDVNEHKTEQFRTDKDGKRVPFNPPRYDFSYSFDVEILVDSPWFSEIRYELSDLRPKNRFSPQYRELEQEADQLRQILLSARGAQRTAGVPEGAYAPEQPAKSAPADGKWVCQACFGENEGGKFCEYCGTPRP